VPRACTLCPHAPLLGAALLQEFPRDADGVPLKGSSPRGMDIDRAGVSADQDEQAVVGGVELRWMNPARWYLPSTIATFDAVRPTTSQLRRELGIDGGSHRRLGLRAYWFIPLASRLFGALEVGQFRSWGLEEALVTAGLDEGADVAALLGVRFARALGPVSLKSFFIGHARGQRDRGQRPGTGVDPRAGDGRDRSLKGPG